MLNQRHITVLLVLAVGTWAIALWILGLPFTWDYSKPFSLTVSVLAVACFIFDAWIWKWPIFKGWLVNRPNLHGTWKVLLKSDWVDPQTKQQVAPIECVMTIRQTYSRLSARLFTRESSSYLVAHKIERQNDGVFQLFGTYQNTPDISLRGKRSEIHYGALVLEVRGDPAKSLVGHYWTDRGTRGSIELTDRIPQILTSYQEGIEVFKLPS
jgi:hypothetical protein